MTNDPAHPDLVEFCVAKTPFEAQVIAGVLQEAGIPTYVSGSLLTDEFALSQQLMGLQNATVQVPKDRLQDAETAIAEAKAAGKKMTEDE